MSRCAKDLKPKVPHLNALKLSGQQTQIIWAPPRQVHSYTDNVIVSPHTARGDGLYAATAGVPASFTIELVEDDGPQEWKTSGEQFIYVWIASEDQASQA